ncbi:MAG: GyrI-like domain-containing protein [Leptospiraceae bacterium]|nr:GyrI-like domain-containing protein [Leptospiraceae bacterium]
MKNKGSVFFIANEVWNFFTDSMNFEKQTKDSFNILGISVRTTGANGQDKADIAKLWQRFFEENISQKISNKKNSHIINLYTDYNQDEKGEYTTILGFEVESIGEVPLGMVGKFFAKDNYAVLKSSGKSPQAVQEAWNKVYSSNLKRTYTADFDIYDSMNAAGDVEFRTFVSIE